jgi:hypothetical protein
MKKVASFAFIFLAVVFSIQSQQIKNFDELMSALKTGKVVKVVVYYGKCQLISDNQIKDKSPDAIGGMKIETFEYFAEGAARNKKAFVTSSESKLIENPIGEGYVYNYAKIKVYPDNTVQVIARYINAKNLEVIMDESFFSEINDGKNDKAIYFFTEKD